MSDDMSRGISRRQLLKRGAALGGAVVWATPMVQTIGMGRAFATNGTPVLCEPDISYIAMCVTCVEEGVNNQYFIKWNAGTGWENTPGATPFCETLFSCAGTPTNGGPGGLGFNIEPDGDCVTVTVPGNCTVDSAVVQGGTECQDLGSLSNGDTVCCPGFN